MRLTIEEVREIEKQILEEGHWVGAGQDIKNVFDTIEALQTENDKLKVALKNMLFVYKNKDSDCPHDFEIEAIKLTNKLLSKESEGE